MATVAGACSRQQSTPIPGHICPSTTLSPGLVPGTVRAGPVFFVSGPEDCQAHAYTYDGARTDRRLIFPSCVEVCSTGPRIAPDGSVPDLTDQSSELMPSGTWAPDSRKICGLLQGLVRPIRVGWSALNAPHDVHVTTYPDLFRWDQSGRYALATCDPTADTATLVADNTTSSVDALAVIDLTRPTVLWQKRFSEPPAGPISVVAAPDARYLAVQYTRQPPTPAWSPTPIHCTSGLCEVPLPPQAPPPVPTWADLYALRPTPHIIGRLTGQRVVGWSGDGSRVVVWNSHGPSGIGDTVSVVGARDGHPIWQTAGSHGGSISAPGLSTLVIQTLQPKGASTIDLIDPTGKARPLNVHGPLIPIR